MSKILPQMGRFPRLVETKPKMWRYPPLIRLIPPRMCRDPPPKMWRFPPRTNSIMPSRVLWRFQRMATQQGMWRYPRLMGLSLVGTLPRITRFPFLVETLPRTWWFPRRVDTLPKTCQPLRQERVDTLLPKVHLPPVTTLRAIILYKLTQCPLKEYIPLLYFLTLAKVPPVHVLVKRLLVTKQNRV